MAIDNKEMTVGEIRAILQGFHRADEVRFKVAGQIDPCRIIGIRLNRDLRAVVIEVENSAPALPLITWRAGPDGDCTYLSPQWYAHTGHAKELDLGQGWTKCIHPADLSPLLKVWDTARQRRKPFDVPYRLHRSDGSYIWILSCGRPDYGSGGEFRGYIGSAIEIENPAAVMRWDTVETTHGKRT
jgi:PAS domain S-box-containing protein